MPPLPNRDDRIEPSLLDKLSSRRPRRRALTLHEFSLTVMRDLSWLLNTIPLSESVNLDRFPEVHDSVINYGWIDLAGSPIGGGSLPRFVSGLRHAIRTFEPRIKESSLVTEVIGGDGDRRIVFEISAELLVEPVAMSLLLKTEIDGGEGIAQLNGEIRLQDRNG